MESPQILLTIGDIAKLTGHHAVSIRQAIIRENIAPVAETLKKRKLYDSSVTAVLLRRMRRPRHRLATSEASRSNS